jgi:NADPH:quinone reductase-like Zn-dependent oxidoreductase
MITAKAILLDGYGPPDVLRLGETQVGEPGPGQIRVAVRYAGVGPTDLAIRAGHLDAVFPAPPGTVLGFEAAGVVESAAIQLAVARGVTVVAAVRPSDFPAVEALGARPVDYAGPLDGKTGGKVDAVFDASGRTDLRAAIEVEGSAGRIITLSDPHGPALGVPISSVVPDGIVPALAELMDLLAEGKLALQPQIVAPLADAASVHARLAGGELRDKVLLEI